MNENYRLFGGKVTLAELAPVRSMDREAAERYLGELGLEPTEVANALALVPTQPPVTFASMTEAPTRAESWRRYWLAAAHILGASFRQLAALHNVSAQAVNQSIDTVLPVATRRRKRVALTLANGQLERYYQTFLRNRDDAVRLAEPEKIAKFLMENA